MATKIRGIEGMKHGELDFEIQRGAKFVLSSIAFPWSSSRSGVLRIFIFCGRAKTPWSRACPLLCFRW